RRATLDPGLIFGRTIPKWARNDVLEVSCREAVHWSRSLVCTTFRLEEPLPGGAAGMGEYVLPWRVGMLGRLQARPADRVVSKFQTQKTGALLAYLALELGRTLPRDRLAAAIWSEGDPGALRNRVNQAVSSLRRQLEAPGSGVGRIFLSDHHSLGL